MSAQIIRALLERAGQLDAEIIRDEDEARLPGREQTAFRHAVQRVVAGELRAVARIAQGFPPDGPSPTEQGRGVQPG